MSESSIMTAEFPTQVRGYAKEAVDRFVHGLGSRLESLESELRTQTDKAAKAEEALKKAQTELSAFHDKERALAGALVAAQEHKTAAQGEIEQIRAQAHAEANEFMDAARVDAERIMKTTEMEAEQVLAEARRAADELAGQSIKECQEYEKRLETLRTEYQQTVAFIRRHLESQIAALDAPGERAVIASQELTGAAA